MMKKIKSRQKRDEKVKGERKLMSWQRFNEL